MNIGNGKLKRPLKEYISIVDNLKSGNCTLDRDKFNPNELELIDSIMGDENTYRFYTLVDKIGIERSRELIENEMNKIDKKIVTTVEIPYVFSHVSKNLKFDLEGWKEVVIESIKQSFHIEDGVVVTDIKEYDIEIED